MRKARQVTFQTAEPMAVLDADIKDAELKAIDALSRYKFAMFGYWAAIWVHLNRIEGKKRPNPFKNLVREAKAMKPCPTSNEK